MSAQPLEAAGIKSTSSPPVPNPALQTTPQIDQALTQQVFKNSMQSTSQPQGSSGKNGNSKSENKSEATEAKQEGGQFQVEKKALDVKQNHFENLFSMMKTIPNPEFIKTYADLFVESRIMEKIIPRDVTQADELENFNPYLIRDTVTSKLVPEGTSPYVGSDLSGINRVSTSRLKAFLLTLLLYYLSGRN